MRGSQGLTEIGHQVDGILDAAGIADQRLGNPQLRTVLAGYLHVAKSRVMITGTGKPGRMIRVGWMLSWRWTVCCPVWLMLLEAPLWIA